MVDSPSYLNNLVLMGTHGAVSSPPSRPELYRRKPSPDREGFTLQHLTGASLHSLRNTFITLSDILVSSRSRHGHDCCLISLSRKLVARETA
jgi:hypothetical protein